MVDATDVVIKNEAVNAESGVNARSRKVISKHQSSIKKSPMERRQRRAGYVFVALAIIFTAVFFLLPMAFLLWWSFTKYDDVTDPKLVGLDNYSDLFADDQFRATAGNTAIFALVAMTIGPLLELALTLLLNRAHVGQAFFRVAFFLPVTMSPVVVSTMRKMLLNDDGLINRAIESFGREGHQWFSDPDMVLLTMCAASIWQRSGFKTVILLAALQGILRERYEVATVDGAGPWRTLRAVTLSALRPAFLFAHTVGIIGALQVYDQAHVMTRGRPVDSMTTVVYYLVEKFHRLDSGHVSAAAYLLVTFLAAAPALQIRLERRPS